MQDSQNKLLREPAVWNELIVSPVQSFYHFNPLHERIQDLYHFPALMDWALDTAPCIQAVILPTNADFLSKRFRAGQGVRGTKFHVVDMEELN